MANNTHAPKLTFHFLQTQNCRMSLRTLFFLIITKLPDILILDYFYDSHLIEKKKYVALFKIDVSRKLNMVI
jgi:hypothetical protein